MNKLFFTVLASAGVLALVSCSDDTTTTQSNTYRSTTTTTDSKYMTGDTMTRSTVQPAPPVDTNTVTDPNAIPYPAIHSNGQHF